MGRAAASDGRDRGTPRIRRSPAGHDIAAARGFECPYHAREAASRSSLDSVRSAAPSLSKVVASAESRVINTMGARTRNDP